MSVPLEHGLSTKAPSSLRFDDAGQTDGFIMVTPRSELDTWPCITDPPERAHALSTPSTNSPSLPRHSQTSWMGPEFDQHDPISQLANAHFPELSAFDEPVGDGGDVVNLDFMPLGDGGDWNMNKEWSRGSDLDGFPASDGFSMGFGHGGATF